MTQPEQQRKGSKLILVLVTLLWLAFLVGILGYKPYMDSQDEDKTEQVDKPAAQIQIQRSK